MESLISRALSHDLFEVVDDETRTSLAGACQVLQLEPGEVLFQQEDPGDAMFVIDSGAFTVVLERSDNTVTLADLGPGDVVGEASILTGQPRNARVSATTSAVVVRLPAADFHAAAVRHPNLLEQFALALSDRLRRQQLASVLPKLSGEVTAEQLSALVDAVKWRHVTSGEVLFREGEPGDTLALVVSGAFDVTVDDDGVAQRVGRISLGEFVGELALLATTPRSATVTAIRDSDVALLSAEAFEELAGEFPGLALAVIRHSAARLIGANQIVRPLRHEARTSALVPLDGEAGRWMAEGVAEELAGTAAWLDRDRFESLFGRPGIADISPDDPANTAIVGWLSRFENDHDYVLYLADPHDSAWTQRCLRQADRVYFMANAEGDPVPTEAERRITVHVPAERTQLVLVHDPRTEHPTGTDRWLADRSVTRHHHLRRNDRSGLQRLARRITGDTVAVVYGGGGARGFVHAGVGRALAERHVPIDLTAGTSMGALASAKMMLDGWEGLVEAASRFGNRQSVVDYTLPVSSLAASRRVTALLESLYGDALIEDLWLPWFCVSTNLTKARPMIHQAGLVRDAVRASISIPGVFTPVSRGGDLVVDGGVMNNLPIDLARSVGGAGHVIAVNASPRRERTRDYEFADHVSGWRLLASKVFPFVKAEKVPSLGATVMRSLDVNSAQRSRDLHPAADLLIAPDTAKFGVLEWEAHSDLIELGYQHAQEALQGRAIP